MTATQDQARSLDQASRREDEATRLSTRPEPARAGLPGTSGFAALRRAWRQLTSMRTALQLLFLLAVAAIPGSFLPQRAINPIRVREYAARHQLLAPWMDRLSLFDVFASPWFAAVYLLLFVSLIGCLGPRIRLHARALRTPPPRVPARLDRLRESQSWASATPPAAVLAEAAATLRRQRWRVAVREDSGELALSAEKGYLRETGNLVFHVSLVLLLVGIALGSFLGFKGTVLVKERDGFANTVFAFDDIHPGRRFRAQDLVPLHFVLDDFRAVYRDDGHAKSFDADVHYASGPDAPLRPYDIRVNHPLRVGGAKVYLLGHGYAPHVVVRDGTGQVAYDGRVACLPQDSNFVSSCVVKVPDAIPTQLAFEGVFTPDTVQDPITRRVTSIRPQADHPALTLVGWRGDLGLDAGIPSSVYQLDRRGLVPVDGGNAHALTLGGTWALPGGGSVTLAGVDQWATFQVTQDPGKGLALLAGCGMILGLLGSLFVRRRRLWVRVSPAPDDGAGVAPRTVVEVGALARTDPEAFAQEFSDLAGRLRAAVPEPKE